MPSITVDLPTGVAMSELVRTADAIGATVERTIGVKCEANISIADLARAPQRDVTRQQECAADAMAAKHGRSRVRHLADGAVEITGMLDDIERETVCIERDGRERWRR